MPLLATLTETERELERERQLMIAENQSTGTNYWIQVWNNLKEKAL